MGLRKSSYYRLLCYQAGLISLLFLCLLKPGFAQEPVEVSGTLTENTIWTPDFTYIVTDDLLVPQDIELLIMAGVKVQFLSNRGLIVEGGSLKAIGMQGESVDTIIFKPVGGQIWKGISFSAVEGMQQNIISHGLILGAETGIRIEESENVIIEHTRIVDGFTSLLLTNSSNCRIANSEFLNNSLTGIRIEESENVVIEHTRIVDGFTSLLLTNSSNCRIAYNEFLFNSLVGVDVVANGLGKMSTGNIFEYNKISRSRYTNFRIRIENNGICSNNIIRNNLFSQAEAGIFIDNSLTVNSGNVLIEKNVFTQLGTPTFGFAISTGMDSTCIRSNIFFKNINTIQLRRGIDAHIDNNSFYQNTNGVLVETNAVGTEIYGNTFTGNEKKLVSFRKAEGSFMNGNNIFANMIGDSLVKNNTASDIDINSNYWGTNDSLLIAGMIWDRDNDENLGQLLFMPFLEEADTNAPVSPPRNLIKQLINGYTKLSWNTNPEDDFMGYAVYQGLFNNYSFADSPVLLTDTVLYLEGNLIDQTIAVTAFDIAGYGYAQQRSGNESPFAFTLAMPYAGPDTAICNNIPTFAVNQSTIPFTYNQLSWSTDGDGSFNNVGLLRPVYALGEEDMLRGFVNLTMTVQRNGEQLQHGFRLTLSDIPSVFAGNDLTLPLVDSVLLSDAEVMFYSSLIWESSGDGYFDDPSQPHPVYYFGEQDIASGELQLLLSATSACGTMMDTLNIYLRNQFSVEGRVLANGQGQTGAAVLAVSSLVNGNMHVVDHTNSDVDGRFYFADLFAADYHFYAVPDTADRLGYLPTYYANKLKWQHAFSLPLTANTYQVEIELTPSPVNLPAGNGRISGQFELPAQLNDFENYCMPWFADNHPAYCDGGLSNVSIILYNDQYNIPMASTITDEEGHFFFNNLPYGRYFIDAEKAGFETTVSGIIELSPVFELRNNIVIRLEGQKNIKVFFPETSFPIAADVFPNPANDWMNLKVELSDNESALLKIYNTAGELLIQEIILYDQLSFGGYHRVNMSDLPMGAYAGQLIMHDRVFRFRFVVSR